MSKKNDFTIKNINNTPRSTTGDDRVYYTVATTRNSDTTTGFDAVDGDITLDGDYMFYITYSAFGLNNVVHDWTIQYSTDSGSTWSTAISSSFYTNTLNEHYTLMKAMKATITATAINKWRFNSATLSVDTDDYLDIEIRGL